MDKDFLPRLGILGGGQLARMMLQSAIPLGVDVVVLAETADSPAGRLTQRQIIGAWDDETTLRAFADLVDVVTLENEFVDVRVLEQLERWGKRVLPRPGTLGLINDKLVQKQTLAAHKLPLPAYAPVATMHDIEEWGNRYGWPLILKARRNGYDGYGNATLRSAADINVAAQRLGWPQRALLVEQMVPFVQELSVLVVRNTNGDVVVYPVVETIQQQHICHVVRAPAPVTAAVVEAAANIARAAVEAVDGIGITAVELFVLHDNTVLVNELAPRPHNSGHFSINACFTSQFENHVRAVLGLPLGDPSLRVPSAVMVNLLGVRDGISQPRGVTDALSLPQVHIHLYGKRETRVGRKLGHVTALGNDLVTAQQVALAAAEKIHM